MSRRRVITTVTQAASSYDLVQLADVKDELGITDTVRDASLGKLITRCSAIASAYCNRVFARETLQDVFLPPDEKTPWVIWPDTEPLQLSRWPIIDVVGVTENDDVLSADTDFRSVDNIGQLYRLDAGGYPRDWPFYNIAVSYDAGYDDLPGDLVDAVMRLVRNRWFARGRDASVMQETIPDVREVRYWVATGSDAGALTPDIQDLLDQYRVPVLA